MERFRGDQRVETPHMLVVPSRSLSLSARAGRKGGRKEAMERNEDLHSNAGIEG
jgi:hypothetical protein